jgi:DNA mismatch repair protein MutS
VSLAWAITEYLHDAVGCRALFATHYHELAQLEGPLPRLRNYTVQVQELESEVIFLHAIAPGRAGKSYGIHVARLAGVPDPVLARAEAVLRTLESPHPLPPPPKEPAARPRAKRIRPDPTPIDPPEKSRKKVRATGPNLFDGDPVVG